MTLREKVVAAARSQVGQPYNSMHTGTDGLGWGCAMLCAWALNSVLGTDYYGSCYNFAGDALGEAHSQGYDQGGGEFEVVSEPEPGDVVLYSPAGYDGRDATDWGHAAMYVGDGRVVGAWGTGTPGSARYWAGRGVSEDMVHEQSLGGLVMYVRCARLDAKKMDDEKGETVARIAAEQQETEPKGDCGIRYRAHVSGAGWLPAVRDGQTAGTEGQGRRMEAIKITPPEGCELDAYAHVQGIGNLYYDGIRRGKSSGTGSSKTDPIIGTVARGLRLEALMFRVCKLPESLKGKKLRYQVHQQGTGWGRVHGDGEWAGSRGKSLRLEAVRIWFE